MYLDMYPVWHQGSAQDTCILMYLMCIPKCILDSFGIRVKYMQNIKIHVFSWNVTGHLRYIWDTSGYMYLGFFITIHQDTPGYKIKIHVSDTKATCGIHAGYIRDTCGIHVSSVAIKIQSRYILDPCKIHAGYMRDTYLGGWGNVLMPSSCAAHL